MKIVLVFSLALTVVSGCAKQTQQINPSAKLPSSIESVTPQAVGNHNSAKAVEREAPIAFREIDFKNHAYRVDRKWTIRLKYGRYVHPNPEGGGGDTFYIQDIYYADLTGDGKEEAIVDLLQVSCGASCDGGSHLFYIFSNRGKRPKLVWRIRTGCLAYSCGLKSLIVEGSNIILETFRACKLVGSSLEEVYGPDGDEAKFIANKYTQFRFQFRQRRFRLRSRQVFPNPQDDVKNYSSTISINR